MYRVWLEPELLRRWLWPGSLEVTRVEVDKRVGGRYRIWQRSADGDAGGFESELLELVPHERIVFRWGFVGTDRTGGPAYDSLLTVTLEEAPGNATTLTLVHERLDDLHAVMSDVADKVRQAGAWRSTSSPKQPRTWRDGRATQGRDSDVVRLPRR